MGATTTRYTRPHWAVEQGRALAAEMAEWEVATIDNGLDDPSKKRR
jgi:hypothetical protein